MAAVMSFLFVEVLCTEMITTILEKSGLLKIFRHSFKQFEPFVLKMLFWSKPKPQLKFWAHPDRSAEGNNSFPVEFTEILKKVNFWKTSPPTQTAGCSSGDSSQHLPLSLQQFQDTVPVNWQGAEKTHHGAGSTVLPREPRAHRSRHWPTT